MEIDELGKPRLRGVSHQAAFFAALGAGAVLLAVSKSPEALMAAGVYVATLLALFGVSALYHRINWDSRRRLLMKRLDHATIFVFIAGSYTPICLLGLEGEAGRQLLTWAWIGAGLGVARAVFWPQAPKPVAAALYVLLGWLSVAYFPALQASLGVAGMGAIAAGGVLFSLGAAVYAFQRPNPVPRVFGYHEVFHALVVVAVACHFAAIMRMVVAA